MEVQAGHRMLFLFFIIIFGLNDYLSCDQVNYVTNVCCDSEAIFTLSHILATVTSIYSVSHDHNTKQLLLCCDPEVNTFTRTRHFYSWPLGLP